MNVCDRLFEGGKLTFFLFKFYKFPNYDDSDNLKDRSECLTYLN